ncbi:hypothetical protein Tco_1132767 [Tanacetum coccineum]|uniref:Uncharacterized protein n=1 Tax=Tanacetum coccineum TaxID=301880 RepID=A0ABQ5JDY5_9ASTR
MNYNALVNHAIHSETIIDRSLLADNGLVGGYFESMHSNLFSGQQWANLFQNNELVYCDLVCEFFATFEFRATTCRNSPRLDGIKFRLCGEHRSLSLVELRWRVGLYFEAQAGEVGTEIALQNALKVKEEHEEEEVAKEDVGGSEETYRGMSRGDWQARQGDHLDPHMQIDTFPVCEADYPPFGYTGPMPLGYHYRYNTAPDGPS